MHVIAFVYIFRFRNENCSSKGMNICSPGYLFFFLFQLGIVSAKGLPSSMSNFVFCQYTFWGLEESVVVPPQINPEMIDRQNSTGDTVTVKFHHKKVRAMTLINLI